MTSNDDSLLRYTEAAIAERARNGVSELDEVTRERLDEQDAGDVVPVIVRVSYGPADYLRAWANEGKLPRRATGFKAIDEACRGGFAFPWRVVIVGAPHAGKTFLAMSIARRLMQHGDVFCGWLGVDEEPEDFQVRLAQMAGHSVAECEARDAPVLEEIARELEALPLRMYGPEWTIEAAADDLAARTPAGFLRLLVVDSAQTAKSEAALHLDNPREIVEANARAVRFVTTKHRALSITTSEANRGQYGNAVAAAAANRMAAGAESRTIEYMAQTLMYLGTPKKLGDVIEADVPKNRRGHRGSFKFWLSMHRERHELEEIDDPTAGEVVSDEEAIARTRRVDEAALQFVVKLIGTNPGIAAGDFDTKLAAAAKDAKRTISKAAGRALRDLAIAEGKVVDHSTTRTGKKGTQVNHRFYAAEVTVTDCACDRCSLQGALPMGGSSDGPS